MSDEAYIEVEHSDDMEEDEDEGCLISEDDDELPLPSDLGVKDYLYISFIYVPEDERGKGVAKKLIESALRKSRGPVYTELVDSDVTNGTVLKKYLSRFGFKVVSRSRGKICMLKK